MKKYLIPVLLSFSLAFLAVGFSACQEDDELPPITVEGKNTFGCLVNGELWLPKGRLGQGGAFIEVQQPKDTMVINIYADNDKTKSNFAFSIHESPTLQTGKTYDLTYDKYYVRYINYATGVSCRYDKALSGSINLSKFDPDKNIISGTFEFKAYSDTCKDTVTITEGSFDIGEILR